MNDEINSLAIQDNLSNEDIKNLIYTIKGKQVMLDSDVARLYHYETRRINETVKRNIERFPIEFCFQLTTKEIRNYLKILSPEFPEWLLEYIYTQIC